MNFSDVATYFDNDPLYDAYTGQFLFNGQVASFDDHASDGSTNRRRVLALSPELVMPARQVVKLYGDNWLVSIGSPDGFQGDPVRRSFGMKKASDLYAVLTPSEACNDFAGIPAYGQAMFLKDVVNSLTDSSYSAQFNMFFAPGEPIVEGTFFRDSSNRLYRVREQYLPIEGLQIAETDRLTPDAFQTVTYTSGAYQPATDDFAIDIQTVTGIQMKSSQFYRWRGMAETPMLAGDRILFVPTSIYPSVGGDLTMFGITWKIIQVQAELNVWALQIRLR